MRRFLSFLLFSLVVQGVSAADYLWHLDGVSAQTFSSPQKVCEYHYISAPQPSSNLKSGVYENGTRVRCSVHFNGNTDWTIGYGWRDGNGCTLPSVYNPETYSCEAPEPDQCEAKAGQSDNFIVAGLQFKMCRDNCELALDSVQPFKRTASSETLYHFFGVYTGESCETNTSIVPGVTSPEATESDQSQECTSTSVSYDSEGRRHETSSCTTTTTDIDNQACVARGGSVGTVDGVMTCVNKGSGPKATETKKEVKQETKENPDGSKTETKTTTTTVTVCAGAKSCTTSTTTTTETTNTNADGTSGGSSSSCRGANCGTDGKEGDGSGTGSGNGSGDGDGICDPATDYCGQAPTAQLKKGEQGSFEEGNNEWDEKISTLKDELDEKLAQYGDLFKGLVNVNLGGGGGSLPCDTVNVSFGRFGSTSLRLCLNDYAEQLSYLRYALLLAASVIAALVVLRD